MQKRPSSDLVPAQSNIFKDAVLRIKLIVRLIADRRVSPWLKILPIGGIAYLLSPLDIIPDIMLPGIGELDDMAILWLTNHFFIEFCPPDVVREHVRALLHNNDIVDEERQKSEANQPEIIEGEATDISDKR